MRPRFHRLLLFPVLASIPLGTAMAQPAAQPSAAAPPAATHSAQPAPADPLAATQEPAPAPLPPPLWTVSDAQQLLGYINGIGREGLVPADYDPQGLIRAMASGDPLQMSAAATERFKKLSSDLALGHVPKEEREGWLIVDKDLDSERQDLLLRTALQQQRVIEALNGLLPTHPQYGDLKKALAMTAPTDVDRRERLRLNMERWRWLPRDLGRHHVFVNIPEFKLRVMSGGAPRFETRVIVGSEANRTPVFSDEIEYVDVNPYWNVPSSIATKEMLPEIRRDPGFFHRRGIQVLYTGNGGAQLIDPYSVDWSRVTPGNMPFRFRQPPGPENALGRVKFMFPNKHAVYLHDTPTRHLFSRSQRALSHGCVRVDDPVGFADAMLAEEDGLNGAKIKTLISGGANGAHPMHRHVPVHLAYFTIWLDGNGELRRWYDVYGYDTDMKRLLGYSS